MPDGQKFCMVQGEALDIVDGGGGFAACPGSLPTRPERRLGLEPGGVRRPVLRLRASGVYAGASQLPQPVHACRNGQQNRVAVQDAAFVIGDGRHGGAAVWPSRSF